MCLQNFWKFFFFAFAFACKSEEPFLHLKITLVGTVWNLLRWGLLKILGGDHLKITQVGTLFFYIVFRRIYLVVVESVQQGKKQENGSFNVIKRMEIRIRRRKRKILADAVQKSTPLQMKKNQPCGACRTKRFPPYFQN